MAQNIVLNGLTYTIPDTGEEDWGLNLTNYFVAIPQGVLQKTGGTFTLTADVNFGANFGLVSLYYKSRSSNLSTAGILRLAVGDSIGWRNNANGGNLLLAIDGSDNLTFNGVILTTPAGQQTLTNKILSDSTVWFGNVSDVTKTFKVSLGGATTGTATTFIFAQTAARSITVPDATDTLALLAATQTFTNKTVSRASNTLSGFTAAAIPLADGTGNLAAGLVGGSSGDVPTWNGSAWTAAAPPSATYATQAEMEAGTLTNVAVSPGRQQYHPSAAKAWAQCNTSGTLAVSYNVSSVTDNAAGDVTFNYTTAFSSANYSCAPAPRFDATGDAQSDALSAIYRNGSTASTTRVQVRDATGARTDPNAFSIITFGDQ